MAAKTEEEYRLLLEQAAALIDGEDDWIANMANISALLFNEMNDVNFAGVYRFENNELILGPFQGKPACVHIALGKGVCGTAAQTQETQLVPDVHQFAGHIACDSASNSEIVVPIFNKNQLWGVLDIDSPKLNNFEPLDQKYLEALTEVLFAKQN